MKNILTIIPLIIALACGQEEQPVLMSVTGPVTMDEAGFVLEHEHILVDFSGADQYDPTRWDPDSVSFKILPFLEELKDNGVMTFIDATPQYLGRDVNLLQNLSEKSGLNILTNTGLYGAVDRKYLPDFVNEADDQELADSWIREFEQGIERSAIKPGFIKISVNPGNLGDIEAKLVEAACITHKATGLTIASHTGPAVAAFEELEILKRYGVDPSAFVWVHAQIEKDWTMCLEAAKQGAWIGFDGLSDDNVAEYVERLEFMKINNVIHRVLISHDAGWYDPDKPGGGEVRHYKTATLKLIPELKLNGFTEEEINQVFVSNPFEAFAIRIRLK
jgi:phosphotriesterase-related protein